MSNIAMHRLLAPVMRGIRELFGRVILTWVNDRLKAQKVQLTALDGETLAPAAIRAYQRAIAGGRGPVCLPGRQS